MFKRKQDLDKHVQSILRRKKDEKERYGQGYQIARLYKEINEYETARRYLAGFLQVRDNNCSAHQLMGEINEGLGNIEAAIESYKRALDIGGFSSANRHLVLRICELFCEQGTDIPRMKYWLEKCESLYPRSDVIYRLKAQIATTSSNGTTDNTEMEKILIEELVNRPCDVDLRIKLLDLFVGSGRIDEAYDTAVSCDLTTVYAGNLQWYQCLQNVFKLYSEKYAPEPSFLQLQLHVLRNLVYLSIPGKNISTCMEALKRFDIELKVAENFAHQDESWLAFCGEMKGQFLYLAGLLIVKRATMGILSWPEANQMCGACFLASQKVSPLDAQAPWFVRAPEGYLKHYQWWHLQSYDRLSQIGHMIRQLAGNDVADWSKSVCRQTMTGVGHKRVFESLYTNTVTQELPATSFFYGCHLMVGQAQEPLSWRQLLDIDRVAYQVHLGDLSHLVWLCLQRYTPEMKSQPNYHFSLMENMRFAAKNLEAGSCESLCQLDILSFLLATVRCMAASLSESKFLYQDSSGRPNLLPACLNKPLCSTEQGDWWKTMFQFCTNSVKDDFSRLRRVLMRGIETVRLIGSHGVSVSMQCHLARCFDAKVESLRKAELGSRCSASEMSALEDRSLFYWTKAKTSLEKLKKNQQQPMVKNCMFREAGDTDLTARQVEECLEEARFAIAKSSFAHGKHEEALEVFKDHQSPWASYYCGEIYMNQAANVGENRQDEVYKALIRKARDCFYQTLDRLNGDKTHELNMHVSKGLDDLEVEIQSFDWDDRVDGSTNSTQTLSDTSIIRRRGPAFDSVTSTPRPVGSYSSPSVNGRSPHYELQSPAREADTSLPIHSVSSISNQQQPRPSPEKLESQIKSLGYSQTTLFKMVLDRNEELVLMHSRMMEEHRNNNNELKGVLTGNKVMMEELKAVLTENKLQMDTQKVESKEVMENLKKENKVMMDELKALMIECRDMLKLMKTDVAALKPGVMPAQALTPAGPQILMGQHLAGGPPRAAAPFPGFHPSQAMMPPYPGYLYPNQGMHPPPPPHQPPQAAGTFRGNGGVPGARLPTLGKYGTKSAEDDDDDDVAGVGDSGEDLSAFYAEYLEQEQSYSQYFTPDSHIQPDWSMRTPLDNSTPGMTPALQPARMAMPQPGFFASALRGQSLQYAMTGQPSPPSGPAGVIRPGFFSPPAVAAVAAGAPGVTPQKLNASGAIIASPSPNLFPGALPGGVASTPLSASHTPAATTTWGSPAASNTAGFDVIMMVKAYLPTRAAPGAITILSAPINKSSVVMVSDSKEMLFHHDVSGLQLGACNGDVVSWTALKIGSSDKEMVTVKINTVHEAETLKQILVKHSVSSLKPSDVASQGPAAAANVATPVKPASTTPAPTSTTPEGGKTVFGKFTFTETPKLTPAGSETEREKAVPHKGSQSPVKVDEPKPFAGFAFKLPAATTASSSSSPQTALQQSAFAGSKNDTSPTKTPTKPSPHPSPAAGGRSSGKGDDDRIEEYEPNVEFKPVINLPALVEKKTGEENETALFTERCGMYRYDKATSQWKERGVGELKILSANDDEVRFRIVMRRDQILKLCANHYISGEMKLSPLSSSDRSWCYSANDFADEEMKMENLAVKFKNSDKASKFKDVFTQCQAKLAASPKQDTTPQKSSPAKPATSSASSSTPTASSSSSSVLSPASASTSSAPASKATFADLFKPKPGSWNCPGCYMQNGADMLKCPSCDAPKPGTGKPAAAMTGAAAATASAKPVSSSSTTAAPTAAGWGNLFKPNEGSWECEGCYIRNNAEVLKCPACETLQPGVKKEDLPKSKDSSFTSLGSTGGSGGFTFGSNGGFTFGGMTPTGPASDAKPVAPAPAPAQGGFSFRPDGGFVFGGAPAATTSSTGLSSSNGSLFGASNSATSNASATSAPSSGSLFAPTTTVATTPSTGSSTGSLFGSNASASTTSMGSGFKFGAGVGSFAFGAATTSTTSTATATAPSTTTSTGTSGGSFSFKPNSGSFTFGGVAPAPTAGSDSASNTAAPPVNPFEKAAPAGPSKDKSEGNSLLVSLLTGDETDSMGSLPQSKPSATRSLFGQSAPTTTAAATTTASTPSSTGFNFSLNKPQAQPQPQQQTPVKSQTKASAPTAVPSSPEVDDQGLYVTREEDDPCVDFEPLVKLPQNVELKTGEEDEDILFEARGKLYRFTNAEWKERGVGNVKILRHRVSGMSRVIMRRERIHKLCCNHRIDPSLSLQPMINTEGKAWVWYALDFSDEEPKMEQLALRLRNAEIASQFKEVFDRCKKAEPKTDGGDGTSSKQEEEDDDVIFVKEEFPDGSTSTLKKEVATPTRTPTSSSKPREEEVMFVREEVATQSQIDMARGYRLPDHFYLYETRPRCPGCLGCTDGEGLPPWAASCKEGGSGDQTAKLSGTSQAPTEQPAKAPPSSQSGKVFGQTSTDKGSLPDFSQLSSSDPSNPVFGARAGAGLDFSSLVKEAPTTALAFKKADTSSPFKFQGAGQALFGSSASPGGGGGEGDDDDSVVPNNDIHFEPVIALPDLVEVKTGEEDWTKVFIERSKLYKFYKNVGQWKECGVGDIKIMKHKEKTQFRILLRRDQILKLACNHLLTTDMNLKPMSSSETAWCWVALDYSDTDKEATVEQFAVRFKKKSLAEDFKTIFEDCQAKLREQPPSEEQRKARHGQVEKTLACHEPGGKEEMFGQRQCTPLGDHGNVYHSKALDVLELDTVIPSSFALLGQKEIEEKMKQGKNVPLGDRGNVYHSKALDVLEQDAVRPSKFAPLGQREIEEQMTQGKSVPLGDQGNIYHSKALDVLEQDAVRPSKFAPLCQREVEEQMMQGKSIPLGDQGNVYHSKALDVLEQDVVRPSKFAPLGQREVEEQMTQGKNVLLGDRGNIYHSKALDVLEQDSVTPSSFALLGQKGEIKEETLTQKKSVPLGDKGNVYHSKALDVLEKDTVKPTSYTPLSQKEIEEQMTQRKSVPLGDQGNVHHSRALDVLEQDVVRPSKFAPLGQREVEEQMTQGKSFPLGDQGNVYHSKALDVLEQDVVRPSKFVPLGQKEVEERMMQGKSVPLGDQGNIYHSKALDVLEQDVVKPSKFVPLGQRDVEEQMTQGRNVPLGDRGNVYHSKALEVLEQDAVKPSKFAPLGQRDVEEQMTQGRNVPLGDKGNVYHSKALDVLEQDAVKPSKFAPLGQKEVEKQMTQGKSFPLGDRGNVYHSKALDVLEQDVVRPSKFVPLGQKEVEEQMTQGKSVPLGDRGNVYHSKALDVLEQDVVRPSKFVPLGQKEVEEQMTQGKSVPLGDRGNVYHSKALDVLDQDTIHPSSYGQLGGASHGQLGGASHGQLGGAKPKTAKKTQQKEGALSSRLLKTANQPPLERLTISYADIVKTSSPSLPASMSPGDLRQCGEVSATAAPASGSFSESNWTARVLTSDVRSAGTDSKVHMVIYGEEGKSDAIPLANKGRSFEQGQTDAFKFNTDAIGKPYKIRVWHDNSGKSAGWHLNKVELENGGSTTCYNFRCNRWLADDQDDKETIREIPAEGSDIKKPLPLVQYIVQVYTGNKFCAGTDANVYIQIFGELGDTGRRFLKHSRTNSNTFEKGQMDEFVVEAVTLHKLEKIVIGHDGKGRGAGWYLDKVVVIPTEGGKRMPEVPFQCNSWLDEDEGDGIMEMEIAVIEVAQMQSASVTSTTMDDPTEEEEDEEEDDEEYEDDEDEEEDDERIIFEKRATLCYFDKNEWKKLALGQLLVKFNEDVNGNSVEFFSDSDITLCSHIICREHNITLNTKAHSCEWQPIDFSMDEPIRRQFRATFSSAAASEEFAKVFREGLRLAFDSELSEKLSTEIDVPEVFSGGAPRH